jgi:hypothetical protein
MERPSGARFGCVDSEAAFASSANGARGGKMADKADPTALTRAPSARTVARLMVGRERLLKAETITVAAIESGVAVARIPDVYPK